MKTIKKLFPLFLVVLLLGLGVGCKKKVKTAEELNEMLDSTVASYKASDNVKAKITLTKDGSVQTIDVEYKIVNNKISELATVLTDSDGAVSVYVKDGVCYTARYNGPKEKYTATDAELAEIATKYGLDKYIKEALEIYNKEFFKASTIEKESDTSYKAVCDVQALGIDTSLSEEEQEKAEERLLKLLELEKVELVISLNDDKVSMLEGTFVKEGKTSTIKIEFLALSGVSVNVPNESEYTQK